MIGVSIALRNPFSNRWDTIFYRDRLRGHTATEIQLVRGTAIVAIDLSWNVWCDHAGWSVMIGLFGYELYFSRNDTRHWNVEAGRFNTYDKAGRAK